MKMDEIKEKYPCPPITGPDDVPNAGWIGNHAYDWHRFVAVERYIQSETDRGKQKFALYLMGKCGMGIDVPVTDEELDRFIRKTRCI